MVTAARERATGRFEDPLTLSRNLEVAPRLRTAGLRVTTILSCQLAFHGADRCGFSKTLP
jgi:hypothetical protein